VHLEPWPSYDEAVLASAQVTIAVQVNGKVRDTFTAEPDTAKDKLLATARTLPKLGPWLKGKEVVKEIVVPNRLVNFVVKD
jgi:leucyl-tRNA synthetase